MIFTKNNLALGYKNDNLEIQQNRLSSEHMTTLANILLEAIYEANGTYMDITIPTIGRELSKGELENIGKIIMNRKQGIKHPCQIHAPELVFPFSTIVEDVEPTISTNSTLECVPLRDYCNYVIKVDRLRRLAKEQNANLGLSDGKILLQNDHLIEKYEIEPMVHYLFGSERAERRNRYIILPGTVIKINSEFYMYGITKSMVDGTYQWAMEEIPMNTSYIDDDILLQIKN